MWVIPRSNVLGQCVSGYWSIELTKTVWPLSASWQSTSKRSRDSHAWLESPNCCSWLCMILSIYAWKTEGQNSCSIKNEQLTDVWYLTSFLGECVKVNTSGGAAIACLRKDNWPSILFQTEAHTASRGNGSCNNQFNTLKQQWKWPVKLESMRTHLASSFI